jgi:hypothetical protein
VNYRSDLWTEAGPDARRLGPRPSRRQGDQGPHRHPGRHRALLRGRQRHRAARAAPGLRRRRADRGRRGLHLDSKQTLEAVRYRHRSLPRGDDPRRSWPGTRPPTTARCSPGSRPW